MNILVTGGAGYIGSHCVKQLLEQGHRVVVLDNLSTGFKRLVLSTIFVEGSIHDKELVSQVLEDYGVTTVMHFAASCHVGESMENPQKYYENNVYGTLQLASAMREQGVKQLIFSSTCSVYGTPETVPITEACPMDPINPYGASKRLVETMLADFSATWGLRYVSFRYFNAAGADPDGELGECHDPEPHLIPNVLKVALGQQPSLTIHGNDYETPDGTCIRDYVHVMDIANAHLLGMNYLENNGMSTVFNLGTGTGFSVLEVAKTCETVTGKKIPIEYGPRRPGDPPVLTASADKLRKTLGWKPAYPELESIIKTAWAWHQKEALAKTKS